MLLAALLFLAFAARVDVVDQVYRIPADEWRYVELPDLRARTALVWSTFQVESERGADVRLMLMRPADLERLRAGLPHGSLAISPEGRGGALVDYVAQTGDYVLVVRNSSPWPAAVHLRIWLDFSPHRRMAPTEVSDARRLAVILISLGTFCGIAGYAAWRMAKDIRR